MNYFKTNARNLAIKMLSKRPVGTEDLKSTIPSIKILPGINTWLPTQ
jgi:hypothetical protein